MFTRETFDRPTPKHKLARLIWTLQLQFEDGTITPIQMMTVPELAEQGCLDDGVVSSIIRSHSIEAFLNPLIQHGIDGLYDLGGNYGGMRTFESFMGAFLHIIPQFRPEHRQHINDFGRLVQAMIDPPPPANVKALIEKAHERQQSGESLN